MDFFSHGRPQRRTAKNLAVAPPAQQFWHKTGNTSGSAGKSDRAVRVGGKEETVRPLPSAGIDGDRWDEQDINRNRFFTSEATNHAACFEKRSPFQRPQLELCIGLLDITHLIQRKGADSLAAVAPAVQLPILPLSGFYSIRVHDAPRAFSPAAALIIQLDALMAAGSFLQQIKG